ncbi:MAG TPA: polysaccharide biosynthesis/export family protein [Verrucomicrobiae bacterium]|nr:polysaccharide biosynthesis/export family protein [Verrucomicrobiae bacterium]
MKLFANGLFMSGLLLIAAVLAGCDSLTPQHTIDGQPAAANGQAPAEVARFRIGETVVVTLTTGSTDSDITPHEEPIKEDGTITMPYIGKITAVGKTTGELQNEILNDYVPKYYVRLTVTVKSPSDRVYYIGGQVARPGVQTYLGETTVSKAIQAAGDFNDFASHTVTLTRVTGERIKVNVDRVLAGKEVDPPVYPGDQIDVPRSLF